MQVGPDESKRVSLFTNIKLKLEILESIRKGIVHNAI